jgi:hypothetical protein
MNKSKLFYLIVCLFYLFSSCKNNKTQQDNQTPSTITDTIEVKDNVKDTNTVDFSEINWNTYLDKNDFEQGSADSSLLVLVKPNYALFVYAQEDSTDIVAYDIIGFKKKDGKWAQNIKEQIIDLGDLQGNTDNIWRLEDINGDGDKDVLLKIAHDGRQRKNYVCYLQYKANETFSKVEHFEQLDNPEYDKDKKVLNTYGAYHRESVSETYRWEGKNLKFIKGIISSSEGEKAYFDKKW